MGAIQIREKYPPNINTNEIDKKIKKSNKSSKSPRDIFKKDIFGNILRPQSSRMTNNRQPNPSYNIFRSRSPSAKSSSTNGNVSSPSGRDRGHSTQTFSFGSWKKKWGK